MTNEPPRTDYADLIWPIRIAASVPTKTVTFEEFEIEVGVQDGLWLDIVGDIKYQPNWRTLFLSERPIRDIISFQLAGSITAIQRGSYYERYDPYVTGSMDSYTIWISVFQDVVIPTRFFVDAETNDGNATFSLGPHISADTYEEAKQECLIWLFQARLFVYRALSAISRAV